LYINIKQAKITIQRAVQTYILPEENFTWVSMTGQVVEQPFGDTELHVPG
jgi:hypothetical protein